MALWGTPDTLRSQLITTERFQIALDYLARALTAGSDEHTRINAVPAGEACQVELGDGVFAIEQAYDTKLLGQGRFEAHERHIDLQAIVSVGSSYGSLVWKILRLQKTRSRNVTCVSLPILPKHPIGG